MKVLVTGPDGFIGKNLCSKLSVYEGFEILRCGRTTGLDDLTQAVFQADFICHLAGVNRPDEVSEFAIVNTGLTQTLCQVVQKLGRSIPIIFASSVHVERNNPYGASKLAAEQVLLRHSEITGTPGYIFRFPHVIGKWCRPNYNSVVATFCYNIARGLPIHIDDPTYPLNFVYIDDLVDTFVKIMWGEKILSPYCQVQPTYQTTVGELARQLKWFHANRKSLVSERVGSGLTRVLYATYISYLPTQEFAYEVPKYSDVRGDFVEMLKTLDSGQVSFFTAHPGVTRGDHYHHSKTEKFLVIKGSARFHFRHILTNEFHEVYTSGDKPVVVEMIPGWTHNITNVGNDELVVMLWANEVFDRNHPDTYTSPV